MKQDKLIDIDILEYLQFIIHKGLIPSDVTLNKAVAEIESLRAQLAAYEKWLSKGVYFTTDEYKKEVAKNNKELADAVQASQAQPTPSQSDEREVFESEIKRLHRIPTFTVNVYGEYLNDELDRFWQIWQARAQLSKPQPTSQDARYNRLMQAFLINMIRAYPTKSHAEITEAINAAMKESK